MKALWCALLLLGAAAQAESGTDDLAGLLDTNVVSGASRSDERAEDAPATMTVVTADDLRRYGVRSLHEAINFLSLGMVAQDPLHAVEVGSRGVLLSGDYGNHMLVVVDGHAMTEQWNGTSYFEQGLGIPLEFIDHLELIVGPGSVLYGSSAMLGVINVVTKRAHDVGRAQVTVEGSALPPQGVDSAPQLRWPGFGGTGRVSVLTGHEATLAGLPFEVSLAAEYYAHRGQSLTFATQEGLTDTDGERTWPQSWGSRAPAQGSWGGATTDSWWTQAPSAVLKARWGEFTLWAHGSLYARGLPARDSFGTALDFDQKASERDRFGNFELRWAKTLSPRLQAMARAYFDVYDYRWAAPSSSWGAFGSGSPPPDGVDPADFTFEAGQTGSSRWGGVEAQATWDWLGDGRFPLMVGADARLRYFEAENTYSADGAVFETTGAYEASEWQLAAYLQQRAQLFRTLQLNVGARVDAQEAFYPRLSPRAALVWTTPWQARLKAVVSTAFRAPLGYERFMEYPGEQIRNPALRPESVLTGELGYDQRFGRHRLFVAGFASNFTDMVRYAPAPDSEGLFWFENGGTLLNLGGHALLEGTVGQLGYAASVTFAVNQTDEPLVASPNWFGNARISWDFGEGRPRAALVGAYSGPRLITAAAATGPDADGQEVGWDTASLTVGPQVELRATVDAPVPAVPGLWVRGVAGGALAPFSAYTVGPRQAPEPLLGFTTPAQSPNSRLFVMLTVGWSLDGP
jgi:outer membrane cobalamin receptor